MAYKSRNVYMISGGLTKFRKYNYDEDFRLNVKNAVDYALRDIKMDVGDIDGSVSAYFSDHFWASS